MKEILDRCRAETDCSPEDIEKIVGVFLNTVTDELSQGHTVDLGPEFGEFSVRLREQKLNANSPRVPKDSHYKVVFREGSGMKKRLKVER